MNSTSVYSAAIGGSGDPYYIPGYAASIGYGLYSIRSDCQHRR